MKKISILLFSMIFLIFSCSKEDVKKEEIITRYQKEGLSFELPKEWKVKQDYVKDGNRYLELDKYSNYKVESTMAIGILKGGLSADSILNNQIEQLKFFYQKVNFKVTSENKDSELGKYKALITTYEADDTKNKVYGQVGIIKEKDRTFTIQIVENKRDTNQSDCNTIFTTFTVK